MKNTLLIFIAIIFQCTFFQFTFSAEEILKDIQVGGIFFVDSEGYIYTNPDMHSITRYSPTGKLLSTIGKEGEGPSDIKRLGWFCINPIDKNVYVCEYFGGNKWISKFSLNGKYLGELNCKIDWKKWQAITFIQFDDYGNAYLQLERSIPERYKDFTILSVETSLVKFLPKSNKLEELYKICLKSFADKGGKGNIRIPFENSLHWKVYRDRIIIKECKDEYISIFDLEGNLKEKILLPFKKEKVTQKDIDDWENYLKSTESIKKGIAEGWFDLKYWLSRLPYPKYKSVSAGQLYIDSQGYLYCMKATGYNSASTGSITWAKINLSNGNATIVKSAPDEWLKTFWKDYIYLTKWDEEDDYIVIKRAAKDFFKAN
ncbi:MAG TPA: hypothetical protein VK186_27210 [Candidatus Deferrimicrobium sp.]|nr:hypothetical protein [Candidatus Kapabacteria bacterium]HLP62558.1 hypothetical protein [Candidatus Deferrimicrobium sp.]